MTVLSLLQPWASLVVMGHKTIETRSWATAYRGPLLIHASKGTSGMIFCDQPVFKKYLENIELPFGSIIGEVTLESIVQITDLAMNDDMIGQLTLEEKIFGDYTTGRYAWMLKNAIPLTQPVPARGLPGLWQFHFQ